MTGHKNKVHVVPEGVDITAELDGCDGCTLYEANPSEWVLATARTGDRIRWRRMPNPAARRSGHTELGPWTSGTFLSSMFYDGIIGRAYEDDPDDYIVVSLRPDTGDLVERL